MICALIENCNDEGLLIEDTYNVSSSEDRIKQTSVVNACKIFLLNIYKVCDVPILEGYDFGGTMQIREENGCIIKEYVNSDGIVDCSLK